MCYHQITLDERYRIGALWALGASAAAIARELGRHRSTIGRELARNRTKRGRYEPHGAHTRAFARRSYSRRNLRLRPEDWRQVLAGLREGWSPEQIAGRGRYLGSLRISHETIYRRIADDWRAGGQLHRHLRGSRKQRRRRAGTPRRTGPRGRSIQLRPASVERRRRLGHWEGDTLHGRGRPALLSLVERKSGVLELGKLARTAAATTARALRLLRRQSRPVRTLTFDNGPEFSAWRRIEAGTGTRIYFATPYHAWERGTNENTNGLVRQLLPADRDLARLTQRDCNRIARQLNRRPRKRLGFRTPEECYAPKT
jgi:transposase, IS30 family